jgi:hypothetical protein
MAATVTVGCVTLAEIAELGRRRFVPEPSIARRPLDTLRLHAFFTVAHGNLQRGAIVSDEFEPTTEYPPTVWESAPEFESPGPMSRPLANYLAMCAPRSRRASRANRFRDHADLVLAGVASVN